ncbi:MAG: hypothetical protein JWP97_1776 [Labilithrix sp.]|nr:hypothetical protein [Labilithrix sp.]
MRGAPLVLRSVRMAALFLVVAGVFAAVGTPGAALAQGAAGARTEEATAALRGAEAADQALDFGAAAALYARYLALDPAGARAPFARARSEALEGHAEGAYAPLAHLERVRRSPALAADASAIDDLVAATDTFPPGRVRIEAWVLAAEAYAYRLGRPAAAEPLLERVLRDPVADHVTTAKAARDLVELRVARGDREGARAAVTLAGDRADPSLAQGLARLSRRRVMHLAATVILGLGALLAGAAMRTGAARLASARALRRSWKLAVGYAAYVAIAGGLLAGGYERGTSAPFLAFGAALVPVLLLARAWSAAGRRTVAARTLRAAVCAAGALGAAFLVLEAVDVAYLEGVGL